MIAGIQLTGVLTRAYVKESDFRYMEVTADNLMQWECLEKDDLSLTSVVVKAAEMTEEFLGRLLDKMQQFSIDTLVVDTGNFSKSAKKDLAQLLKKIGKMPDAPVICIENGYDYEEARYIRNGFTDISELREFVTELNQSTNSQNFGIAINVGHANLFAMNISGMIRELSGLVKVIHLNDNDAEHDMHQMPYTFTTGRGALATDWYGIAKALFHINYTGCVIFDLEGAFANVPEMMVPQILNSLYGIIEEWEYFKNIETRLNQPEKKLILFGAGVMFVNYMNVWGKKYPPAFLVDNNSAIWNTSRNGIEIKSPQDILTIPPQKRNVFICSMYYKEIKQQLDSMGIESDRYEDRYI